MATLDTATMAAITIFPSIALYNVAELSFIIFATFKRRSGLYFWSFVVATWGIVPHAIGFMLKAYVPDAARFLLVAIFIFGWWGMVTGQSLVLYSRLHLVLHNNLQLRLVLAMIITNVFVCHVPVSLLAFAVNSSHPDPFLKPYSVYEKLQVTIFFVQEVAISGLYIKEAIKLMRMREIMHDKGRARGLIVHLLIVNVIIVLLDINIMALEYANLHDIQTSYKTLVYSVKLKIEFSILNRLVELTRATARMGSSTDQTTGEQALPPPPGMRDGEMRMQQPGGGLGNSVCVASSASAAAAKSDGPSVVMTTEVSVRRMT
ncbi:hypothetical protein B0T25DRAFT_227560 [Lasiosphaeria hispida]|uniref:DUF7703 domain-containing protein n=1 Tax=Lasiosphaeria hispida TaxID=260671 RepID=A0AAJ0MBL3_9PEZI|nr:hypothetical protein B0T25DRAFT_227560 [Lasiosphaeria hispida]